VPAGLHVRSGLGAVDHLGEDAGRGGLADASGSAEKVCMGKLTPLDGVLQRACYVVLTNQRLE